MRSKSVSRSCNTTPTTIRRIRSAAPTVGAHGGGIVQIDVNRLYQKGLRIIGTAGSRPNDVESTMQAAAEGKIRAIIGKVMPLREAAEAHRLVESNLVTGKVMLEPGA